DTILEPEHQVAPHRVAACTKVGDLPPTAVHEANGRFAIVTLADVPSQRGAVPFRMVTVTTHHHATARLEFFDRHAKDHLVLFESEFGLAAGFFLHLRVGGPPAAHPRLRGHGGIYVIG